MQVVDLMTARVITAMPGTELKQAAELMVRHRVSGLPVVDSLGTLVGMITEADFLRMQVERADGAHVSDLMSSPVLTVTPELPLVEAARMMLSEDVNRMPVMTADGAMVGIISRFDVVNAFTRPDELIEDEIREDIIRRVLFVEPDAVGLRVDQGTVFLSGELESKGEAALLTEMVRRLDGVVEVESALTWR